MNKHAFINAPVRIAELNQDGDKGTVRALVAHIDKRNNNGNLYKAGAIGDQRTMLSLWNHSAVLDGEPPVTWGRVYEKGKNVYLDVDYDLNDPRKAQAYRVIQEAGESLEWSVGLVPGQSVYRVIIDDDADGDAWFTVEWDEAKVAETSPVYAGADPETRTIKVNAYAFPESTLAQMVRPVKASADTPVDASTDTPVDGVTGTPDGVDATGSATAALAALELTLLRWRNAGC